MAWRRQSRPIFSRWHTGEISVAIYKKKELQKHFAIAICISQTYIVLSSHLSELLRSLAVSSPSLTMAIIEASPLNNNTLKGASQKQTKTPKEDPTPMFKDLLFNMVARRRM